MPKKPTREDGRRRRARLAKARTRFLEDPDGFVDGEVRLKLDHLRRRGAVPAPEAEARLTGILARFYREPAAMPVSRLPAGRQRAGQALGLGQAGPVVERAPARQRAERLRRRQLAGVSPLLGVRRDGPNGDQPPTAAKAPAAPPPDDDFVLVGEGGVNTGEDGASPLDDLAIPDWLAIVFELLPVTGDIALGREAAAVLAEARASYEAGDTERTLDKLAVLLLIAGAVLTGPAGKAVRKVLKLSGRLSPAPAGRRGGSPRGLGRGLPPPPPFLPPETGYSDPSETRAITPQPPPEPPRDFDPEVARKADRPLQGRPLTPPDVAVVEGLTFPELDQPRVLIFPDLSDEIEQVIIFENRKGNALTKAQLDLIRAVIQSAFPTWTHIGGGRDAAGNEIKEYRIPGPGIAFEDEDGKPGDSRPGSFYTDLTFETPEGRIIHIQTVDLDKHGMITDRELRKARQINRVTEHDVILIPKSWQR